MQNKLVWGVGLVLVFVFLNPVCRITAAGEGVAPDPTPGSVAVAHWLLGAQTVDLILTLEKAGKTGEDVTASILVTLLKAAALDLDVPAFPKKTGDAQGYAKGCLSHVIRKVVPALKAEIPKKHGRTYLQMFDASYFLNFMIQTYDRLSADKRTGYLKRARAALEQSGIPPSVWNRPLSSVESAERGRNAVSQLVDARIGAFRHIYDKERRENTPRFNRAGSVIWAIGQSASLWALSMMTNSPTEKTDEYRDGTAEKARSLGLDLALSPAKEDDPTKARLAGFSHLALVRVFFGMKIEKSYGLQAKSLFQFSLDLHRYWISYSPEAGDGAEKRKSFEAQAESAGIPSDLLATPLEAIERQEPDKLVSEKLVKAIEAIERYLDRLRSSEPDAAGARLQPQAAPPDLTPPGEDG